MASRIKLFIPLIIFVILAGIFLVVLKDEDYDPQSLPSALIDKPVPEFSLPQVGSDTVLTRADIIGKPMLLNIWATWCISCRVEHPYLNQLSEQGVFIIGVDYKDDRAKAQDWLGRLGNPYSVNLFDKQGSFGLDLGVYGAPETYLIDSQGVIRYKHVGVVDDVVWKGTLKPMYDKLVADAAN
ncbi:Thiol:disulfide interchange protein DsbE [BD1-7 clade bacterium]|uniref:Thiol:disulfide interchange protein DsbE n=1 Tax=BD1-7 clade bacterium TaxID=2029982 RepID=A0A5S9QU54_9GAMM|nr:Thiol:disulfide interchange protein DsbE [BD1-7 clade bacterium]